MHMEVVFSLILRMLWRNSLFPFQYLILLSDMDNCSKLIYTHGAVENIGQDGRRDTGIIVHMSAYLRMIKYWKKKKKNVTNNFLWLQINKSLLYQFFFFCEKKCLICFCIEIGVHLLSCFVYLFIFCYRNLVWKLFFDGLVFVLNFLWFFWFGTDFLFFVFFFLVRKGEICGVFGFWDIRAEPVFSRSEDV